MSPLFLRMKKNIKENGNNLLSDYYCISAGAGSGGFVCRGQQRRRQFYEFGHRGLPRWESLLEPCCRRE